MTKSVYNVNHDFEDRVRRSVLEIQEELNRIIIAAAETVEETDVKDAKFSVSLTIKRIEKHLEKLKDGMV